MTSLPVLRHNNYTPPEPLLDLHGPDPWDVNFVFPVPSSLENDVVRLTPFIPRLHADAYWDVAGGSDPDLYQLVARPVHTKEDFVKQVLQKRSSPDACLFLIVDKTKPEVEAEGSGLGGAMAGVIGLIGANPSHLATELGPVIILKSAQRSHVTPNSTGLMLQYLINLPSDPTFPGLGLRRVQWMCYNGNARSAALAQRLGFHMEGTLRWLLVCVEGSTIGDEARPGDPVQRRGRHDLMYSMCWDDWESHGRATVEKQMARRV